MQEFDLEIYRANAYAKLLSFFEYLYIKLGLKEDEKFLKEYFEIVKNLSKPERKFAADMIYGMLAGGSCLF